MHTFAGFLFFVLLTQTILFYWQVFELNQELVLYAFIASFTGLLFYWVKCFCQYDLAFILPAIIIPLIMPVLIIGFIRVEDERIHIRLKEWLVNFLPSIKSTFQWLNLGGYDCSSQVKELAKAACRLIPEEDWTKTRQEIRHILFDQILGLLKDKSALQKALSRRRTDELEEALERNIAAIEDHLRRFSQILLGIKLVRCSDRAHALRVSSATLLDQISDIGRQPHWVYSQAESRGDYA